MRGHLRALFGGGGLLLVLLASLPAWADCPLDLGRGTGLVIFSDHYLVAFRPEPLQIEVGEPFSLLFNVCTKSNEPAELVAIDAQMPEFTTGRPSCPWGRAATASTACCSTWPAAGRSPSMCVPARKASGCRTNSS